MKIVHWTLKNGSGLHRTAEGISKAEQALGLDSITIDTMIATGWEKGVDADIHCVHSHLPDVVSIKKAKIVHFIHGTPEHAFKSSVEQGLSGVYAPSDSWMIGQYWLQHADISITFWPRHQAIWQSLCDKKTIVHYLPMGIDKSFWKPVESRGKFAGEPSLFTAENCHDIKWPLDLFMAWEWITDKIPKTRLHAHYLPRDQWRWWFPLVNRNGAAFKSFISGGVFNDIDLRNCFNSIDYYIGLVRYGDHNRICLEAKSSGTKLISFCGNKYADYWVHEGDQRNIADEIIRILKGEIMPRETDNVVDICETVKELKEIYEKII